MGQEDIEMDGVVDVGIPRVEGPSASCEVDSWNSQMEGEGTVLDDAGSARVAVEPYRWRVGVGTGTGEAEGRHSAGYRMGNGGVCEMVSAGFRLDRQKGMEASERGEGNMTYVGRRPRRDAHRWCTRAGALLC
jgi:hypothetical protein